MPRPRLTLLVAAALLAGCPAGGLQVKRPQTPGKTDGPATSATATPGPASTAAPVMARQVGGVVVGLDGRPAVGVAIQAYLISDHGSGLIANNGGGVVSNNGGSVVSDGGAGLIGKVKHALLQATAPADAAVGEARTDAAGRFRLALPAGRRVNLEAVQAVDVKAFRADVGEGDGEVQLQLAPTGSIAGRLVVPAGSTVTNLQGARVFIPGTSYAAFTDAEGAFTISNVPAGTFAVAADQPGVGAATASGVVVASKQVTQVPALELRLRLPTITTMAPTTASVGTTIEITGANFGASTGEPFQVMIGGFQVPGAARLRDDLIRFTVPKGALSGDVSVAVGGVSGNGLPLRIAETLTLRPWAAAGTLRPGEPTYVSWRAEDALGRQVDDLELTWTAEGDVVDVAGPRITAQKAGTAVVRAAAGALRAEATVRVGAARGIRMFVGYPEPDLVLAAGGEALMKTTYEAFQHTFLDADPDATTGAAVFEAPWSFARDPQGRFVVFHNAEGPPPARRIDLVTGEIGVVKSASFGTIPGLRVQFGDVAPDGRLYMAGQGIVNRVDSVELVVGEGTWQGTKEAGGSEPGYVDAQGEAARFHDINAIDVADDGTIYVADNGNHAIRAIAPDGTTTTIAGNGTAGFVDGPGASARLKSPTGLALDGRGGLWFCDLGNGRVRRIDLKDPAFPVRTVAGGGTATSAVEGPGEQATFNGLYAGDVDADGSFVAADTFTHRIVRVAPDGMVTSLANLDVFAQGIGPGGGTLALPLAVALDPPSRLALVAFQGNRRLAVLRY